MTLEGALHQLQGLGLALWDAGVMEARLAAIGINEMVRRQQ